MRWVVSLLLVVICGLLSLAICLLPVRGQSLLTYSPVWVLVLTTRCQGPGGFVDLWKCGLRHCLPCKVKQRYTRGGHGRKQASLPRHYCNPAGWDLNCTSAPSTRQSNSPLRAVPHWGGGFFQCHLSPLSRLHSTIALLYFYNWERAKGLLQHQQEQLKDLLFLGNKVLLVCHAPIFGKKQGSCADFRACIIQ